MSDAPPAPSFPTAAHGTQGDPLGLEHPSGGLNASPYYPFSPGEECESCCPRSPLLLPRWDRLQRTATERRGPWWRGTTMASGTVPREGTPACRARRDCQGAGSRGREGRGKRVLPSPGSSVVTLPLAPFASPSPFPPPCVRGVGVPG